jgi:hypothetical protein
MEPKTKRDPAAAWPTFAPGEWKTRSATPVRMTEKAERSVPENHLGRVRSSRDMSSVGGPPRQAATLSTISDQSPCRTYPASASTTNSLN